METFRRPVLYAHALAHAQFKLVTILFGLQPTREFEFSTTVAVSSELPSSLNVMQCSGYVVDESRQLQLQSIGHPHPSLLSSFRLVYPCYLCVNVVMGWWYRAAILTIVGILLFTRRISTSLSRIAIHTGLSVHCDSTRASRTYTVIFVSWALCGLIVDYIVFHYSQDLHWE